VTRDPIAFLNWTSPSPSQSPSESSSDSSSSPPGRITKDFHTWDYRAKGHQGEYLVEAYMISRPERAEEHEWFFVPDQMPHEVLVFKFADTESQFDLEVAACCGHGSPFLVGSEREEARESIEARVSLSLRLRG
jgi:hypothetical protein